MSVDTKRGVRVILLAVGSAGDTFPMIGLAKELNRRGHRVVLAGVPVFRKECEGAGLEFHPLGTEGNILQAVNNPDLWHPLKGLRVLADATLEVLKESYDAVLKYHEPGNTVCVASLFGFGARVARETLGIPLATLHYQPGAIFSCDEPPIGPEGLNIRFLPKPVLKMILYVFERLLLDQVFGRKPNAFRRELGLKPVKRIFTRWVSSPDLVLCGFPDWYAPAQSDWPKNLKHCGFPLYDAAAETPRDERLERFLAAGPPPVVFTFGTAMMTCRELMTESVLACERAGLRGILLVRDREMAPAVLPPSVACFSFAPLSVLLPRASALVHHGGIGTLAQALAAGCPQLVVPFAFDQPDNADRARRLGVAAWINPRRYRAAAVARALKHLLESSSIRAACAEAAKRMKRENGIATAADAVEELMAKTISPA